MTKRKGSAVSTTLREYVSEKTHTTDQDAKSRRAGGSRERDKMRSAGSGLRRERTEDVLKRQEIERHEQSYKNWQIVKEDVRDDRYEKLRSKITIQKELIQANDRLYEKRQQEKEEETAKKREAARLAHLSQEAALVQICRESLDEDRKQLAEKREQRKQAILNSNNKETTDDVFPHRKSSNYYNEHVSLREQRLASLSKSAYNYEAASPVQEEEEELDENDEDAVQDVDEENLPWHHLQLYNLYGKQMGDHFLYPKMEPVAKALNPKLKRQGGRAGAGTLWTTLRYDSRKKLLKEDEDIPKELKLAYSAFVRQLLARKKMPVKRNYYCKEDVPEMERLLDQSVLVNVQDLRHKHELMHRSSRINQDRTGVLTFNNPMPDFNNFNGEDSVERYMPSWLDDQSDVSTEYSYKKWLSDRHHLRDKEAETNRQISSAKADVSQSDKDEWAFLRSKKNKNKNSTTPRVLFLTEEEASCAGQFSLRQHEKREGKNIPAPHAIKAHSALAMAEDNGGISSFSPTSVASPSIASARARSALTSEQYTSKWQPLSMNALVEYKKEKGTVGEGTFRQGRHRMFPVEC